jgi:hypothetical protein
MTPRGIATALPGTWAQSQQFGSTVFHLVVTDTTLAGDGTFALEAGASGTLTVQGSISAPNVTIVFTRSDGLVGHLGAQLVAKNVLRGVLMFTPDPVIGPPFSPQLAEFHRTGP